MKKKIFSLVICFILLVLAGVNFMGCNEKEEKLFVSTLDGLKSALMNNNGKQIQLIADITSESAIEIIPSENNYNFTLDLNGHNISAGIKLNNWVRDTQTNSVSFMPYGINAKIYNSNKEKTSSIGADTNTVGYGLTVNSNEKVNVELNNVNLLGYYCGIGSNGLCSGAKITAKNCTISAGTGDESAGAYMPANYTYNFNNCTFSGDSGYYAKSGTHTLTNCTVLGSGEFLAPTYFGNGFIPTGSAIVIDSAAPGYTQTLNITIDGGSYTSTNGYGLEEVSTTKTGSTKASYAQITIKNNPTFTGVKGATFSENSKLESV